MKKKNKEIIPKGYDEAFKILMKHYFEPFATVITDYEILRLPKRVDIIIIEADKPITEHVKIFKYFKRYNIIEFKSEKDIFKTPNDIYKSEIYIAGFLLKEKEADGSNTTFTLVSSKRPEKLLNQYNAENLRPGLYKIAGLSVIPINLVIAEELEIDLESEIAVIKEFTSTKDRGKYLNEIIEEIINGSIKFDELLSIAISLYLEEINNIIKKKGYDMTLVERNLRKAAELSGLREKYINEGMEKGMEKGMLHIAQKAISEGLDIEIISRITGLTKEQLMGLKN